MHAAAVSQSAGHRHPTPMRFGQAGDAGQPEAAVLVGPGRKEGFAQMLLDISAHPAPGIGHDQRDELPGAGARPCGRLICVPPDHDDAHADSIRHCIAGVSDQFFQHPPHQLRVRPDQRRIRRTDALQVTGARLTMSATPAGGVGQGR